MKTIGTILIAAALLTATPAFAGFRMGGGSFHGGGGGWHGGGGGWHSGGHFTGGMMHHGGSWGGGGFGGYGGYGGSDGGYISPQIEGPYCEPWQGQLTYDENGTPVCVNED